MVRQALVFAPVAFFGFVFLLSRVGPLRRLGLRTRLEPYVPGSPAVARRPALSPAAWRDLFAPAVQTLGDRIADALGATEPLARRLRRVHADEDPAGFRIRQLRAALLTFGAGLLAAVALAPPTPVAVLLTLGSPALALLWSEQALARRSAAWQRRLLLELPTVAEQLGMLLSTGWSLGAALARLAERGAGCCAADLTRATNRVRQGLSEVEALREWADLADVDALDRLVAVFALNRETADIGRLVADEARSMRRAAHRELVESIERRTEQVWIPVTVAALVPGVLLMGVPFVGALEQFAGG